MPPQPTLHIRQRAAGKGKHTIQLTLRRPGWPDLEGEATIKFNLSEQEQEELRWYMEDYLQREEAVEPVTVEQVERLMRTRGEELYRLVLAANLDTQAIWFAVREQLADLRVEIAAGVAEAASIPWELMRDPASDSPLALRVKAFVRVQSNPIIGFLPVPPPADGGRLRLLFVASRPRGTGDVALRAVANRLLQDLGGDLARFEITALRPPTYEQLQRTLTDAKAADKAFHIVHFDGHGMYADLGQTGLPGWLRTISLQTLGGPRTGKHGYLLFEDSTSPENMRPVAGDELGMLLRHTGVPVLVLNACQSAMHEASERPAGMADVHDEVRAIGSLAQAVIDQGIPAMLGMRYSVFVVTAAQYIGELYAALAKGRSFGEAASQGRKHLAANPERWVGLEPRPLQDWFVPVVYETAPMHLLSPTTAVGAGLALDRPELDPVQTNQALRRFVPGTGFVGRDETLLLLDRAFDAHPVVLLHAYAGQGKTATAVEFARWYAMTGGLGPQPFVIFTSFEQPTDLDDALNQVGQLFGPLLQANGIEWHALNLPGQRRQLVMQLLRQIPVLWIWDNVEPVAGFPAGTESQWTATEQAELADFLKQVKLDGATKAKILLTSRRDEQGWLGGVPRRIAMSRMSRADAARLAHEIGRERGLGRTEVARWGPLLDYCAGNPLALRVVAGQAVRQGLRTQAQIAAFIQAVRDGEQQIQDVDAAQGRDQSLGASLDYGCRHAFHPDELSIIALLHLFQGTVDVGALDLMSKRNHALPELQGKTKEQLTTLLDRAAEVGLLAPLTDHASRFKDYYTIHPALPWYLRQLFAHHYDGQAGRSSAEAALRAWVEAMGALSNYYFDQYETGNRGVIGPLALEEANLLHAHRAARRQCAASPSDGGWDPVISAMQGLRELYEYQGRTAEWARLVAEIVPAYCTPEDGPIPGREDDYSLVMGYRVGLARRYDLDLPAAAALQAKLIALHRQQAAPALVLPAAAPLDAHQRHRIRTLAMSLGTLGQILMEQGSPDCVAATEETIRYCQRIGDTAAEAIAHYNLGHAYYEVPAIRDLDAAEAAYWRSLELRVHPDAEGRSRCIKQIGMVHHERFSEARQRGEPDAVLLQHAQAAEQRYQQALALCPPSALTDVGPIHTQLGNLYHEIGATETANEHYQSSIQVYEQTGNRHGAGQSRYNMALLYLQASEKESDPDRQKDLLRRSQAYAQSAERDFQHYQGRDVGSEERACKLIDIIEAKLTGRKDMNERQIPQPHVNIGGRINQCSGATNLIDSVDQHLMYLLAAGDLSGAISACQRVISHPDTPSARKILASIRYIQFREVAGEQFELGVLPVSRAIQVADGEIAGQWLAMSLISWANARLRSDEDPSLDSLTAQIPDTLRATILHSAFRVLSKLLWPEVVATAEDPQPKPDVSASVPSTWQEYLSLGYHQLMTDSPEVASVTLKTAAEGIQKLGNPVASTAARYLFGSALKRSNNNEQALLVLQSVVEESKRLQLHTLMAKSLLDLCHVLRQLCRYSDAKKSLAICSTQCERSGFMFGISRAEFQHGLILAESSELEVATDVLCQNAERYLALLRRIVAIRDYLGETTLELGQEEGDPLLESSSRMLQPSMLPDSSRANRTAGRILFQQLVWPLNLTYVSQEAELNLLQLCLINEQLADSTAAAKVWKNLAEKRRIVEPHNANAVVECWLEESRLYRKAKRPALSKTPIHQSMQLLGCLSDRQLQGRVLVEKAEVDEAQDNLQEALNAYRDALRYFDADWETRVLLLYRKARLELRMNYVAKSKKTYQMILDAPRDSDKTEIARIQSLAAHTLHSLQGGNQDG